MRVADGAITVIDPPGSIHTVLRGIDNKGTVAGNYAESGFLYHGFSRAADGTITILDIPKSKGIFVAGIGHRDPSEAANIEKKSFSFLRSRRGRYETFEYPDARQTEPHGVNLAGAVVGIYRKHQFDQHGFVRYPDGTFELLRFGKGVTWPVAINGDGVIAGDANYFDGFVRAADGTVTLIAVAGADQTEVAGINEKGAIVGTYYAGDQFYPHGFIWTSSGGFTLFDVPGSTGTTSAAINDSGEVTGTYFNQDGSSGSFMRTE